MTNYCDYEAIIKELVQLEEENRRLKEANALLSRLVYHASKKLQSYRIPVRHATPSGRISFARHGDAVIITYSEASEAISQTGDPDLDSIFNERRNSTPW